MRAYVASNLTLLAVRNNGSEMTIAAPWMLPLAQTTHSHPVPPPPEVWAVIIVIALLGGLIPTILRIRGDRRARDLLDRWASSQGLELRDVKLISFRRGPFRMRGRWTSVFRIRASSAAGERTGWVCMNNVFVWGGGNPDVRWD